MNQKNVLFINTGIIWGGVEGWHFKTAKSLKKRGYNVFILAAKNTPFEKKCKKAELNVETINTIGNSTFVNLIRVYKLVKYLRKNNIEAMFFCQSSHFKFASLCGYLAGVKKIIYRRALAKPINNHLYNRVALKNFVTDFMAISKTTLAKSVENLSEDILKKIKIQLIYNGVKFDKYAFPEIKTDLRKEFSIGEDEIIIANIGRLGRQKAQQDLIKSIEILKNYHNKFKVLFVGTGNKRKEYEHLVSQLGLEEDIIFTGFRNDIPSILSQVDFVAHTAIYEGCPWIVLETMAAGKPIVSVDIPSVEELVCEGVTGYLVERDYNKIANGILKMINNNDRDNLGYNAQKICQKNYTFNNMVDKIESEFLN
ncbi:glycosyltransferase [Halanaerobium sp. MA284_MarDTE_T2]|uniref:glycosyltransferase n=1 Tax=Halanaerobium sp. MA284_MarDTE_T2 TaxID=2183913 RepID=UPI000DF484E0|nr:glycosyltransferase [Halanaerobium sp. MA284_MarDTE_T2]RCW45009.1 glycosyltransferase involved in cell wall biosynthesis [Halanaerobium sp. MA284_MarDTE_T2]